MPSADVSRPEFRVDGVAINIRSMREAVSAVTRSIAAKQGGCFFTLNLDHCAKLRRDTKFRQAYRRARFVSADGFPIVLLGRLNGFALRRTTGADLVLPLCAQAARRRMPVFLFGPNTEVLRRARAVLSERSPGLDVADTFAPAANFDPESVDADIAIARIRQSGACICFLAVGAPRQEIFAARCLDRLPGVCLVCVGAALDFIAGSQRRAPLFVRRSGLEWLWRLSKSPRRLGLRYLMSAAVVPRLVAEVLPQAIAARASRAP
jgi:exopolysaccharide biosynthesis WecB/TagA/CpsF family protein